MRIRMLANVAILLVLGVTLLSGTVTGAEDDRDMEERQALELSREYLKLYNTDPEQFVLIYSEDCVINGGSLNGREELLALEKGFLAVAPKRKMRVDATHLDGNVAIVQGVILNPDRGDDWNVPFCAILTCKDGFIVSDWTYAEFGKLVQQ